MYVYTVLGIADHPGLGVYPTWPMSGMVVATCAHHGRALDRLTRNQLTPCLADAEHATADHRLG